ncbi:hypothetical protein TNCV_3917031 [Trichonephila clavipes]|nr:hypothetical protein TNCV_3917031 [Trichonephila clavipes]
MVGRLGNASRREPTLAYDVSSTLETGFRKHVKRSHQKALAHGMHSDGKPVPIELSIATIPSDGRDPQVMGIMVNHAGLTSTPNEL